MKKEKKDKMKKSNCSETLGTRIVLMAMAIVCIIVLVVNLILLALNMISVMYFWGLIIVIAGIAYWVMPRLKERE